MPKNYKNTFELYSKNNLIQNPNYYFFENVNSSKLTEFFIDNIDIDKYIERVQQIDDEEDEEMQTI